MNIPFPTDPHDDLELLHRAASEAAEHPTTPLDIDAIIATATNPHSPQESTDPVNPQQSPQHADAYEDRPADIGAQPLRHISSRAASRLHQGTSNVTGHGSAGASPEAVSDVHVAIITALPVECAAMRMLIDDLHDQRVPGDANHYRSGRLPSKDPDRPHRVVLALPSHDGTRSMAALFTDMARSFPAVRAFVMCGIAGGIPQTDNTPRGVRLGDIVVATTGIVDYDHVRTIDGVTIPRRPAAGISAALVRADQELERQTLGGHEPWLDLLEQRESDAESFRRPAASRDPLHGAPRPADSEQDVDASYAPRVHRGAVGSSDTLLRDDVLRDQLAQRHEILAVEMEASGMAAAADLHDRSWFMVRGIADYCGYSTKNDDWHPYSALAAASYVRALLAHCDPMVAPASSAVGREAGIQPIVDVLMELAPMRDEDQRRAVVALLPEHIRTAVPGGETTRLHLVDLVHTCLQFPGGIEDLSDALELALGSDSPGVRRTIALIRARRR